MSVDLAELERAHERRSRRLTAADRRTNVEDAREALTEARAVFDIKQNGRSIYRPRTCLTADPGLLARTIRVIVQNADRPLTAFDISREVQKRDPGCKWSRSYVEKKAHQVGLYECEQPGLSPAGWPCRQYTLEAGQ